MTTPSQAERLARAALTCLAEPGDPVMGALLGACTPPEIVAALTAGRAPVPSAAAGLPPPGLPPPSHPHASGQAASAPPVGGLGSGPADPPGLTAIPRPADSRGLTAIPRPAATPRPAAIPGLDRALRRWSARLGDAPSEGTLATWQHDGIRLVIPGDAEWPGQLDVLGDARPWGLWVRGNADLRYSCLRSVSIVGTRAATAYGAHVCTEMAMTLAEGGWTVISGGAYGIDGCAHRGVVTADGATIAVLACGVDYDYPQGHSELFHSIRVKGATVSEWPPGRMPTRHAFLVRNRVITALSRGTVVVEAALRSGALNSARHAYRQNRPLMAVPGPVTSAQSAGCHEIIREWGAVCVTSAQDVMDLLAFPTDHALAPLPGPVMPRDQLDPVMSRVLDAVPARAGQGPARIAVAAGVDFDQVMSCLGGLAAAGFVERSERGWRLRRRSLDPS